MLSTSRMPKMSARMTNTLSVWLMLVPGNASAGRASLQWPRDRVAGVSEVERHRGRHYPAIGALLHKGPLAKLRERTANQVGPPVATLRDEARADLPQVVR